MAAKKINLGTFAAGEIPYPVEHQFTQQNTPIDLDGFTTFVNITGPDEATSLGAGAVIVIDEPNGIVRYTWVEDDMQFPGKYQMLIWVDDTATPNRFASDLIVFEVYDGPGPTPT